MKQNSIHNYLLGACVVVLLALCYFSISSPIHFDRERQVREMAVKRHLLLIRQAAEKYRNAHDLYPASLGQLVSLGYLADSLRLIPYAEGDTFAMGASVLSSKTDRPIPVMECRAEYAQYLKGLDREMVSQLTTEAVDAGRFPGLKIGDLNVNQHNAGNWE